MAKPAQPGRALCVAVLAAALIIFAIATAPAWLMGRVVALASRDQVRIEQPAGGFWTGKAAAVAVNFSGSAYRFENLSWHILPGRLLRGDIAARLALADARMNAQGIVASGGKRTTISGLQATLPADFASSFVPLLALWKPGGVLHIDAARLGLDPLQAQEAATVTWTDATLSLSNVAPLGDYQMRITPTGDRLGLNLQTTAGALVISGSGQYAIRSGGEFRGTARAAPGFADPLAPLLQIMGPKNADGSVGLVARLPGFQ